MVRLFFVCFMCIGGCVLCIAGTPHFSETVVEGFSHPESVIAHNGMVYVANIGTELQPAAMDGDGFISALRPDGSVLERKFLPVQGTLNAPKGMAIVGSTLYVADINRIVGFDLTTRKTVFELAIPETSFLNDLAVRDDHNLFASATDLGKIVEVDLTKHTYTFLALPLLQGPNGLWYEHSNNTLYCVEFGAENQPNGEVIAISFAPLQMQKMSAVQGYLDGVQMYNGKLYVSDWKAFEKKGVVHVVVSATGVTSVLSLPELIGGPADFFVSFDGYLLLPAMLENRVYIRKL